MKENSLEQDEIYRKEYLNQGEEDQMEVEGYRSSRYHKILCWFGVVITCGLLRLVFYWLPRLYLTFAYQRCKLRDATKVLVIEEFENHRTYYIKTVSRRKLFNNSVNKGFVNESFIDVKEQTNYGLKLNKYSTSATVNFINGTSREISNYRLIIVKKLRYIWVNEESRFLKLVGFGSGLKNIDLHEIKHQNKSLQLYLREVYGLNAVTVNVQSYFTLLLIEVSSPYYIFQLFSLIIWGLDNYFYYAYAIVLISVLSIGITVIQTHKAQANLRKTVELSEAIETDVEFEIGKIEKTSCKDLVPGDRIVIPDNEEYTVPCDAVILTGACIVQESMLTGESIPLTKTALPGSDESFSEKESSNHLLFNGTKVIQTRREEGKRVVALVLRTGFSTAKGDLVRAILYPPPVDYAFEQSVYSFINISAVVAVILAIALAVWMALERFPPFQVFLRACEIVTMVIPAAIPGSLTLSKVYAIQRFRKNKIACINPKVINVAGSSNCICFDKTGTITEDGLDVKGVVPASEGNFKEMNVKPSSLENCNLKISLACCHSLSMNQDRITGDPLDTKMFESTQWLFEDKTFTSACSYSGPIVYPDLSHKENMSIRLLHQNQFVSSLQRMSVITQTSQATSYQLYCKGSPEMIASLSRPQSVPSDLDDVLESYTKKGYRVLAMSCRQLEENSLELIKKTPRSELEKNLEFLGLLILENKIKVATKPAIAQLKKGKFKITMITGDNMQTAICVSRECEIIENNEALYEIKAQGDKLICNALNLGADTHEFYQKNIKNIEEGIKDKPYKLALSGNAWEVVRKKYEEYVPQILVKTAVFARMTSRQKQQVVTDLQGLGYCVVMCGDGANDCAALKAANVGVSLSQAEASVASPLSSATEDISCIPTVIREGRSSLTASFELIKFILCYGFIQMTSALISHSSRQDLSDFEYIWEDIFVVMVLILFFSLTESYKGDFVPDIPITKMISLIPVLSLITHAFTFVSFQIIMNYFVQTFPWFVNGPVDTGLPKPDQYLIAYTYKNYAVYSISIFQIFIGAIVFSKGYPYRKPLYTNYLYVIILTILIILTGLILTYPEPWVQTLFVLALPPVKFRYYTLGMIALNFLTSYVIEYFLIEYIIAKKLLNSTIIRNRTEKLKYESALELSSNREWLSKIIHSFTPVRVEME